ncbi:hypothetical protein NQ315_008971 [Exocentrus adspersus]|uniref:Uncharacterized protein n=1 Tax=Exocentrus adspersus TaxID=1586481 RepID=A0AAV8VI97_9CUCU|nr:hypothetical protein NQ315_008971 [Exocentrus adspersus]
MTVNAVVNTLPKNLSTNRNSEAARPGASKPKENDLMNKQINKQAITSKMVKSDNGWRSVRYKSKPRNKHQIVRQNKNLTIKGVPRMTSLHVSRVDKDTSAESLALIIKEHFPEVQVQQIAEKFREMYVSFRGTILDENFNKAMNPSIWPAGACISR